MLISKVSYIVIVLFALIILYLPTLKNEIKIKIMQNRNVIKIFAIIFAIVCLYQLSFTWVADGVEDDAVAYAAILMMMKEKQKKSSIWIR